MVRNYNRMRCWRGVVYGLILLFGIAAGVCFAAERPYRPRPQRDDAQNPQPEEAKQDPRRKEAQATFTEIETHLTQILEKVNKNQQPSTDLIRQAAAGLEKNKRFSLAYEDNQRAGYMLLQSWTSFYQGNLPEALSWSLRACKLDETNQDAWISQAVFSLLSDKRPLEPRPPKPAPRRRENGEPRRPRRAEGEPAMPETTTAAPELTIKKGTLEFNLAGLHNAALKERFDQVDLQKEWGSEIGYEDGKDTLCLLFWQSEEGAAAEKTREKTPDANDVAPAPAKPDVPADMEMPGMPGMPGMPDMMGMPGMPAMGSSSENLEKTGLKGQQKYFEQLFEACQEHTQVKFVQINTDRPAAAKKVADQLLNDPEAPIMVPLVFASESGVEEKEYAGLNAAGPIMVIMDKNKKVKYVGPAAYFVPAFMVTALTGVELDLEKISRPKEVVAPSPVLAASPAESVPAEGQPPVTPPPPMPPEMMMPGMPGMPGMPPGMMPPGMPMPPQPPKPADPNAPKPADAQKQKAAQPRELTAEDQVIAEHLLAEGQLHIEESRKLRGKNPGKGIEACRKLLKEYAGTEYAEQARQLLRRVPERYRQQYNITDAELGY